MSRSSRAMPGRRSCACRGRGIPTANIHVETASGARHDRPVLTALLGKLEKGDTLVAFKLDRLGRSLAHLVKVLEGLEARGIGFETLDGVSTKGSTGKLVLHILGSVVAIVLPSSSITTML